MRLKYCVEQAAVDDVVPGGAAGGADDDAINRGDVFIPAGDADDVPSKNDGGTDPNGESDDKGDPDSQDDKAKKAREPFLPKSRYDAKAAEVKELRAQLAEVQKQNLALQQQLGNNEIKDDTAEQIETLDQQIEDARADGKTEEVVRLMRQQRNIERSFNQKLLQAVADSTRVQAVEEVKVETIIDQLEKEYPMLDPNNEAYDKELVQEVLELRDDLIKAGKKPSVAMLRAVRLVVPGATDKAVKAIATDAVKEAEGKGPRKTDVKDKLATAAKQPPRGEDGLAGDTAGKTGLAGDVSKLSYEDFQKLPKDTISRLRGDML